MSFEVSPSIAGDSWPMRAHELLEQVPPLVIPAPAAETTRMYAYVGSRACVSRNLLWFENAFSALRDGHFDLSNAAAAAAEGFPQVDRGEILIPGRSLMLSLRDVPEPNTPDRAVIARAERFRYFLDNAATRISTSFDSTFGLLASYYGIQPIDIGGIPGRSEILNAIADNFPGTAIAIEQVGAITDDSAYAQGERYRNHRIHDVGTSLRALYGHGIELGEIVALRAGLIGMKPVDYVPPDEQLTRISRFYDLGKQFLLIVYRLIEANPRYSSARRFTSPDIVYGPIFHKQRDGDNFLGITDEFSILDEAVHCSFVPNGCLNKRIAIRFSGPGWDKSTALVIDTSTEKRVSIVHSRDTSKPFQRGRGRVTIEIEGTPLVRRRFDIRERSGRVALPTE